MNERAAACYELSIKKIYCPCVREFASLKSYINLARTAKQRADLAQLVERVAFNHVVVGSSPTVGGFIDVLYESRTVEPWQYEPPKLQQIFLFFFFFSNSIL